MAEYVLRDVNHTQADIDRMNFSQSVANLVSAGLEAGFSSAMINEVLTAQAQLVALSQAQQGEDAP